MKKHFKNISITITSLFLIFFFVGTVNAQTVEWIRNYGQSNFDELFDIVIDDILDEVVHVGRTSSDALVRKTDLNGNLLWQRTFSSTGGTYDNNVNLMGVDIDQNGNIAVVGRADGILVGQTGSSYPDPFVKLYDKDGIELWTKQFSTLGTGGQQASKVKFDSQGNVIIVGFVSGALTGQTHLGSNDAFVRKYDSSGNEIWTVQFGAVSNVSHDFADDVAIDSQDNIIVVGRVSGSLSGQTYDNVGRDAFVRKYDSSGNEIWTVQYGSNSGVDSAESVVLDSNDDIFVSGSLNNNGYIDAYLRKYSADGVLIMNLPFNKTLTTYAHTLERDNFDNIYITGEVYGGAFEGETWYGGTDAYVRKYNSNGSLVWTNQIGTLEQDIGYGVDVVNDISIFVNGTTRGEFTNETITGFLDGFIAKFTQPLPNLPATANAGTDQTVNEGDLVNFDASASSDPDGFGDIASFDWDFGDGASASGQLVNHTYIDDGVYSATLTVTDTAGESDTDTVIITVNNLAPVISPLSPIESVLPNRQISIGTSFTDAGIIDTHTATIDWGDNTSSAGTVDELLGSGTVIGSHTYNVPGTYTITLTVTDGTDPSSVSTTVQILTPNQAIDNLVDLVETFNLQQGIDNSLDAKLDAAINALDDMNENNDQAAINSLQSFISAVEAQRGNKITNEQADALIAAAQEIIDYLSL